MCPAMQPWNKLGDEGVGFPGEWGVGQQHSLALTRVGIEQLIQQALGPQTAKNCTTAESSLGKKSHKVL